LTTTTGISGRDAQNMVCGKTYRNRDRRFLFICMANLPTLGKINSPLLQHIYRENKKLCTFSL